MTLPTQRCPGSLLDAKDRETCPCCHATPGVGLRTDGTWAFMYHERIDPYRGLPHLTTNEDGDIAWAAGHISAHVFVRALVRCARVDGWWWHDTRDLLRELFANGRYDVLREVEYVWLREDPANGEIYHLAEPWHPKAQAFTQLVLPA